MFPFISLVTVKTALTRVSEDEIGRPLFLIGFGSGLLSGGTRFESWRPDT